MKKFFLVLSMIAVLILAGCNSYKDVDDNLTKNDDNQQITENNDEKVEDKKLFYFVGSQLIAISENGTIRPPEIMRKDNISYKELLSEEFYTAYHLKRGIAGKIDKINVSVYDNKDGSWRDEDGIREILIPYAKKVGSGIGFLSEIRYDIYELELPLNISNEVLERDAYLKTGYNGYGAVIELDTHESFVTNANFDINFEQKSEDVELSDGAITKIKEYIENNGLANDVPYFCSSKFVTDLDGDNKKEKVYVIETSINGEVLDDDDYDNISKTGALSLILIERENEEVEIMFESNIKPFIYTEDSLWDNIAGYFYQKQLFIADIDNDKDKEIIIDVALRDVEGDGMLTIYSLKNDKYEESAEQYWGYAH